MSVAADRAKALRQAFAANLPTIRMGTFLSSRVHGRGATIQRLTLWLLQTTKTPLPVKEEGFVQGRREDGPASHSVSTRKPCRKAAGRSPGSQVQKIFVFSAAPTLPRLRAECSWERLPAYSGGTAPALHRLPFYARVGTRSVHPIVKVGVCKPRRARVSSRVSARVDPARKPRFRPAARTLSS